MKLRVNIKVKEIRNSDASPSDLKLVGKASAKRTVPLFAQGVAYPVHFTTLNNAKSILHFNTRRLMQSCLFKKTFQEPDLIIVCSSQGLLLVLKSSCRDLLNRCSDNICKSSTTIWKESI